MTNRERMLAKLETMEGPPEMVRRLAREMLNALDSLDYDDEDAEDEDDQDAAYMDALRRQWPEASDDEIENAHALLVAVADEVKQQN